MDGFQVRTPSCHIPVFTRLQGGGQSVRKEPKRVKMPLSDSFLTLFGLFGPSKARDSLQPLAGEGSGIQKTKGGSLLPMLESSTLRKCLLATVVQGSF